MKKFKERMAERAGFTLVELIVVIAILGILAGIAVPAYTGYIKKADEATDYTNLDAIKTAAVFTATEDNLPNAVTVDSITVTGKTDSASATVKYTGTVDGTTVSGDVTTAVNDYFNDIANFEFKSDATSAVWHLTDGGSGDTAYVAGWTLNK